MSLVRHAVFLSCLLSTLNTVRSSQLSSTASPSSDSSVTTIVLYGRVNSHSSTVADGVVGGNVDIDGCIFSVAIIFCNSARRANRSARFGVVCAYEIVGTASNTATSGTKRLVFMNV